MDNYSKMLASSLLAYCAQRDLPVERLCLLADVDLAALQTGAAKSLTGTQIHELWINAVRLSKDKLFGLHFGESLQLSALGAVGQLIKSCQTVGDALSMAASLVPLITPLFEMRVGSGQSSFFVEIFPSYQQGDTNLVSLQLRDFLTVFTIHELDGLVLKKVRPLAVVYPFTPENSAEYERVLRCRPILSAGKIKLDFDLKDWALPIITSNYEMQQFLIGTNTELKNLMAGQPSFKGKVFNYLLTNAYLGVVSLDQLAANFNISARTLQRKLNEEGFTFQQITDEVRKSLAIAYLKAGSYQLKEISYMLGYNETSAFSRTFKRWTGSPPASYQRQNS